MTWRGRKLLAAIVEGHGEQRAIPVLVRRWIKHVGAYDWVTNDQAIRASGVDALKAPHVRDGEDLGVEWYVDVALRQGADAVLVVLDADEECVQRHARRARPLGVEMLDRCHAVIGPRAVPVAVVVADREYEAWFLAMRNALRASGVATREWSPRSAVEDIANCKQEMKRLLGRAYSPSVDQPLLTQKLPLDLEEPSVPRSYRKLLKELARIVPPPEAVEDGRGSLP